VKRFYSLSVVSKTIGADQSVSVLKTTTDTHGAISTTYQIIGYVDAHNGLGEIVRSHYSCQITGKPDNIWVVRSFEIV
ncbi:hypothetical protein, partial [Shewanella algae]